MDTYVQAVTDEKREAQNKVVKMLLPGIQEGSDSVIGRFWIRGKIAGCPQVIENVASRTGVEPTRVAAVKEKRPIVIQRNSAAWTAL